MRNTITTAATVEELEAILFSKGFTRFEDGIERTYRIYKSANGKGRMDIRRIDRRKRTAEKQYRITNCQGYAL